MGDVKFSIITVTKNAVDTIERTIQSVINQSYHSLEYIVVDGESQDGTLDILENYKEHIDCLIVEADNGIYDAMNKGISFAAGDYIAFLNGNDWYEQDALEIVADVIEKNGAEVIYGLVKKYDDNINTGYIGISDKFDIEQIHLNNLYCHQGLFISKKVFEHIGRYETKYRFLADYAWLIKAHNEGINPYVVYRNIANYTMGGASSSLNAEKEWRQIVAEQPMLHDFYKDFTSERGKAEFCILLDKNQNYWNCELFSDRKYYIWGTGKYGIKCYELLQKFHYKIDGVIDSKKCKDKFCNHIIISPEEFYSSEEWKKADVVILIATKKYENEIFNMLSERGIDSKQIIGISKLFECAYLQYHNKMDKDSNLHVN